MIRCFLSILILLAICGIGYSQNMTPLDEFQRIREMQEKSLRNPATTPLLPSDRANFNGLSYFDFDQNYRVKAKFVKTDDKKIFLMPTSTGGSRKYLKTGTLIFKLNGQDYSLSAFKSATETEESRDLFIPYRDLTNGKETYGAGRYVYVLKPKNGDEVILDFNWSHNPSCAYGNSSFACTLPPKENYLSVGIKAGEKKYISPNAEENALEN